MSSSKSNTTLSLPELLAPAGSYEKLVTAIHYGADAVYFGGEQYSLRARATNFSEEDIIRGVDYAHAHGVRVYATVNIYAHNADLVGLGPYLLFLHQAGVDALIVADPGVIRLARREVPKMELHLSTQANVTNLEHARFWEDLGLSRINLARELGLAEIQTIRQATDIALEVFVHGSLCISYSGRCLLSTYFTGRDANQGDCAHPCRYSYALVEEKRPNQYFPVEEDERGTYIFNSKDLCLLGQLPAMVASGVHALKIEGRMKSVGYVGAVVRLYRLALNWLQEEASKGKSLAELALPAEFFQELAKIGTRGQSENFFQGVPTDADMLYKTPRLMQSYVPVGLVLQENPLFIETRQVLLLGDEVEYLAPRVLSPVIFRVIAMETPEGQACTRANPGQKIHLVTEPLLLGAIPGSLMRKNLADKVQCD